MRILVSADDLGLTTGITDGILRAADSGCLSSTSVLANGEAFSYAMEQWRRRPGLLLTAHLNLMEGRPVLPPRQVPLLVDARGEFSLSFPRLLVMSQRLRGAEREALRGQIRDELEAQIASVAQVAGSNWRPRVDGHQHYHMIPIVLDAVLELHRTWNFSYVRATSEPFFIASSGWRSVTNYLGPNVIKHSLLRVLSDAARKRLARLEIAHPRWFVGLLFSGQMTIEPVRAALARVLSRATDEETTVEILLHPGRALPHEVARWKERRELEEYYTSPGRDLEYTTLTSREFAAAVSPYLGITDGNEPGC